MKTDTTDHGRNASRSATAMKTRPARRTGRKGLGRVAFVAGMTGAALIGSAGVADAAPAPMIPAASDRAPITWRVGEYQTQPFDARSGDRVHEHYATSATGEHIVARCGSIGGHVEFLRLAGFNGYYCADVDF